MNPRLILTAVVGVGLVATAAGGVGAMVPRSVGDVASAPGVVEGTVHLAIVPAEPPPMLSPYARRRYRPPAPQATGSSLRDVVVYLILDTASGARGASRASISQRGLTIIPHVTVVEAGTTIDFPNEDDVFHNLFSLSGLHPFNLGRYPPGDSRSETFTEPGVVRMFCDIHSEMAAVILIVDSPHFGHPDESGRFRLTGVPAGRHRLVAWHEAAGADTIPIVVSSSGTTRVDFRLPR